MRVRALAVLRTEHLVTESGQQLGGGGHHRRIVIDHQDGLVAARHAGLDGSLAVQRLAIGARQHDRDRRSRARAAVDTDLAATLLHESVHHAHAKAGTFACALVV
jgi:hypothetical protein